MLRGAYIYVSPLVLGLGLNALSPVISEISAHFQLARLDGLMMIGGLNNLLLFLPLALFSLLYSFSKRTLPLHYLAMGIALPLFSIFYFNNLIVFTTSYLVFGSLMGLAIPTFYANGKKYGDPRSAFQTSININIMLGVGLALGQYLSAVIGSASPTSWKYTYLLLACLAGALAAGIYLARFKLASSAPDRASAQSFQPALRRATWLLLAQYLPGAVPWGALTVFIFPHLEANGLGKQAAVLLVTVLAVSMIAGAYVAGLLGDALKRRGPDWIVAIIMAFFLFSIVYTILLIQAPATTPLIVLAILYFLGGLVLSVPGASIKGMLFDSANEDNIRTVFSLENFLESIGKGIGPFVVALLIQAFGNIESALIVACFFWLLCLIPLAILYYDRSVIRHEIS